LTQAGALRETKGISNGQAAGISEGTLSNPTGGIITKGVAGEGKPLPIGKAEDAFSYSHRKEDSPLIKAGRIAGRRSGGSFEGSGLYEDLVGGVEGFREGAVGPVGTSPNARERPDGMEGIRVCRPDYLRRHTKKQILRSRG
jgi:hypothetical protein